MSTKVRTEVTFRQPRLCDWPNWRRCDYRSRQATKETLFCANQHLLRETSADVDREVEAAVCLVGRKRTHLVKLAQDAYMLFRRSVALVRREIERGFSESSLNFALCDLLETMERWVAVRSLITG